MRFSVIYYLAGGLLLLMAVVFGLRATVAESRIVSFAADVRPILKTKCMSCHGGVRQMGNLSFLFERRCTIPCGRDA